MDWTGVKGVGVRHQIVTGLKFVSDSTFQKAIGIALSLTLSLTACSPTLNTNLPIVKSKIKPTESSDSLSEQAPVFLKPNNNTKLNQLPHQLNPEMNGKESRKPDPQNLKGLPVPSKSYFKTLFFDTNYPDVARYSGFFFDNWTEQIDISNYGYIPLNDYAIKNALPQLNLQNYQGEFPLGNIWQNDVKRLERHLFLHYGTLPNGTQGVVGGRLFLAGSFKDNYLEAFDVHTEGDQQWASQFSWVIDLQRDFNATPVNAPTDTPLILRANTFAGSWESKQISGADRNWYIGGQVNAQVRVAQDQVDVQLNQLKGNFVTRRTLSGSEPLTKYLGLVDMGNLELSFQNPYGLKVSHNTVPEGQTAEPTGSRIIISPAYHNGKYDVAKIDIKAPENQDWVLDITRKDDGLVYFRQGGTGNQTILFEGRYMVPNDPDCWWLWDGHYTVNLLGNSKLDNTGQVKLNSRNLQAYIHDFGPDYAVRSDYTQNPEKGKLMWVQGMSVDELGVLNTDGFYQPNLLSAPSYGRGNQAIYHYLSYGIGIDDNDPNVDESRATIAWKNNRQLVVKTPVYEPPGRFDQVGLNIPLLRASSTTFPDSSFTYDPDTEILTHTLNVPEDSSANSVDLEIFAVDKVANDWTERWSMTIPLRPGTTPPEPSPEPICINNDTVWMPSETENPVNLTNTVMAALTPKILPTDLYSIESNLRSIAYFEQSIQAEQAKAKPDTKQINQWQTLKQQFETSVAANKSKIESKLAYLDQQRILLRKSLNIAARQDNFSQEKFSHLQDLDLPQSVNDYKLILQEYKQNFVYTLQPSAPNSVNILDAARMLADAQELYSYLIKADLAGLLPLPSRLPAFKPETKSISQLQIPSEVAYHLETSIFDDIRKLRSTLTQLQGKLSTLTQNFSRDLKASQTISHKSLIMHLLAQGILNPTSLEVNPETTPPSQMNYDQLSQMADSVLKSETLKTNFSSTGDWISQWPEQVLPTVMQSLYEQNQGSGAWVNLSSSQQSEQVAILNDWLSWSELPTNSENLAAILLGLKSLNNNNPDHTVFKLMAQNQINTSALLNLVLSNISDSGASQNEIQTQIDLYKKKQQNIQSQSQQSKWACSRCP